MKSRILCAMLIGTAGAVLTACDNPNSSTNTRTTSNPNSTSSPTNSSTHSPSANSNTSSPTTPPNADNTARNKDDEHNKTPMDQSNSSSDVKITAEIRKAIMDDKAMSTNAQNCKIITDQGVVTLRGPVDTQAEKDSVEAKARAVVGVSRVDNQLEVKKPA